MANRYRADVALPLDGENLTLRLTLGALAEIETALSAGDLVALGERFATGRLSARDLVAIVGAAARGGGSPLTDAAIAARITADSLPLVASAVAKVFSLSFGEGEAASPNPREPHDAG